MRVLLVFIITFVHINMHGQISVNNFFVKNVYYISIDIDSKYNYPIMFDVVLNKKDSLLIDTSSKTDFISRILHNSIYVPRCWSSDLFLKLYGETGIDTYNRFRNVFFDEMEKNGRKKTIKLTSGEIVNITYFELKGVFIQLDKEISFSYGLNKEDNPKVNSPFIPIAITEINHGGQFLIENDYRE